MRYVGLIVLMYLIVSELFYAKELIRYIILKRGIKDKENTSPLQKVQLENAKHQMLMYCTGLWLPVLIVFGLIRLKNYLFK